MFGNQHVLAKHKQERSKGEVSRREKHVLRYVLL